MRKVILSVAISLDGYIEGPNGEYDWCFTDQDYGLKDFYKRIDTVFVGRKTYTMIRDGDVSYFKFSQYVFSTTLKEVDKNSILISGNIETEVNKIKHQEGKDIWVFGGAGLTTSLLNKRLIDEIHLALHPILLGAGKPLFKDIDNRIPLTLIDSKTYTSGLIGLKYAINE